MVTKLATDNSLFIQMCEIGLIDKIRLDYNDENAHNNDWFALWQTRDITPPQKNIENYFAPRNVQGIINICNSERFTNAHEQILELLVRTLDKKNINIPPLVSCCWDDFKSGDEYDESLPHPDDIWEKETANRFRNGEYTEYERDNIIAIDMDMAFENVCRRGFISAARILLKFGIIDPSQDTSALSAACKAGHMDIVQLLLNDTRMRRIYYNYVFPEACRGGSTEIVNLLITFDESKYQRIDKNILYSGLIAASDYGHWNIVTLLIFRGVDFRINKFTGSIKRPNPSGEIEIKTYTCKIN